MNVPESFFRGEIRNGFYVEKLMKKVWAAELEILHDVDRLCKKHNIQYFADYGTLLGAVRHQGFIPWDDDIDISMKRKNYTRFCEIAQEEFKGEYEVVNVYTDEKFKQTHAVITNAREITFAQERMAKFHGCPFMIGLDIFQLDCVSPSREDDEMICEIVRIITETAMCWESSDEDKNINIIYSIENICGVKFDHSKPYPNQLRKLRDKLIQMYNEDDNCTHIAYFGNYVSKLAKWDIYPKEYYASTIEVPFEYTTVPIPIGYEKILIQKYGKHYMTPHIGGSNHDYPVYKSQLWQLYEANGNV